MADWNPSLYLQFDAERTARRLTCFPVSLTCR
jgi:trans-aconitate methyltransferase